MNNFRLALVFSLLILVSMASIMVTGYVDFSKKWSINIDARPWMVRTTSDGNYIVLAILDPPTLIAYDHYGNELWKKSFDTGYLAHISVDPNGKYVVASLAWNIKSDPRFKIYSFNIKNGFILWESKIYKGYGYTIEYSPDGLYLAVASGYDTAMLLDPRNGLEIWSLSLPLDAAFSVEFGERTVYVGGLLGGENNGVVLAVGMFDRNIKWKNTDIVGAVFSLRISSDKTKLYVTTGITLSGDKRAGQIFALNPKNGDTIWESERFNDYIWELVEMPNKWLVATGRLEGIAVVSPDTGSTIQVIETPTNVSVETITNIPGTQDVIIGYYHVDSGKGRIEYATLREAVPLTTTTTTSTSTTTTTTTKPTTVFPTIPATTTSKPSTTWVKETTYTTPKLPNSWGPKWIRDDLGIPPDIYSLEPFPSPNGRLIAIAYWENQKLNLAVLETDTGRTVWATPIGDIGENYDATILWSPDSSTIYVGVSKMSPKDYIIAYDVRTGSKIWERRNIEIDDYAISSNGEYLLVTEIVYHDTTITILSTRDGSIVNRFNIGKYVSDYYVTEASSGSSDNSFMLVLKYCSETINRVALYELVDPVSETIIKRKDLNGINGVYSISVSPDKKYIALWGFRKVGGSKIDRSLLIDTSTWNIIWSKEAVLFENALWSPGFLVYVDSYPVIMDLRTMNEIELRNLCIGEIVYILPNGDLLSYCSRKTLEDTHVGVMALYKADYPSQPVCENGRITSIEAISLTTTVVTRDETRSLTKTFTPIVSTIYTETTIKTSVVSFLLSNILLLASIVIAAVIIIIVLVFVLVKRR